MTNIFDNIGEELIETPKMSSKDFIDKTKKMLQDILDEYGKCYYNKVVDESHYNIAPCENCVGCGHIEDENKKIINCFQDRENGECIVKIFDELQFTHFMEESILFGDKDFFELLNCEII